MVQTQSRGARPYSSTSGALLSRGVLVLMLWLCAAEAFSKYARAESGSDPFEQASPSAGVSSTVVEQQQQSLERQAGGPYGNIGRESQPRNGMSFHEVLKLYGAPLERKEREARRETVWEYPERQIFFKEGRVVAWASGGQKSMSPQEPKVAPTVRAESDDESSRTAPDDETIRLILGEIMNGPDAAKR